MKIYKKMLAVLLTAALAIGCISATFVTQADVTTTYKKEITVDIPMKADSFAHVVATSTGEFGITEETDVTGDGVLQFKTITAATAGTNAQANVWIPYKDSDTKEFFDPETVTKVEVVANYNNFYRTIGVSATATRDYYGALSYGQKVMPSAMYRIVASTAAQDNYNSQKYSAVDPAFDFNNLGQNSIVKTITENNSVGIKGTAYLVSAGEETAMHTYANGTSGYYAYPAVVGRGMSFPNIELYSMKVTYTEERTLTADQQEFIANHNFISTISAKSDITVSNAQDVISAIDTLNTDYAALSDTDREAMIDCGFYDAEKLTEYRVYAAILVELKDILKDYPTLVAVSENSDITTANAQTVIDESLAFDTKYASLSKDEQTALVDNGLYDADKFAGYRTYAQYVVSGVVPASEITTLKEVPEKLVIKTKFADLTEVMASNQEVPVGFRISLKVPGEARADKYNDLRISFQQKKDGDNVITDFDKTNSYREIRVTNYNSSSTSYDDRNLTVAKNGYLVLGTYDGDVYTPNEITYVLEYALNSAGTYYQLNLSVTDGTNTVTVNGINIGLNVNASDYSFSIEKPLYNAMDGYLNINAPETMMGDVQSKDYYFSNHVSVPEFITDHSEYISGVISGTAIDRTSNEYKTFAAAYAALSDAALKELADNATWAEFTAKASAQFKSEKVNDTFEDEFYSEMLWTVKAYSGDASGKKLTKAFSTGNSVLDTSTEWQSQGKMGRYIAKNNGFKYLSLDVIPYGPSVNNDPYIYLHYDAEGTNAAYARLKLPSTSTSLDIEGARLEYSDGTTAANYSFRANGVAEVPAFELPNNIKSYNNRNSQGYATTNPELYRYLNINYNRAYKLVIGTGEDNGKLAYKFMFFDNDGKLLFAGGTTTNIPASEVSNLSDFSLPANNSHYYDNCVQYLGADNETKVYDFIYEYGADALYYNADAITPATAKDIALTQAAISAAGLTPAQVEAVAPNYTAIVANQSVIDAWNACSTASAYAECYKTNFYNKSGVSNETKWQVLNALNAETKALLTTEKAALITALNTGNASEKVKIAYFGDSQTELYDNYIYGGYDSSFPDYVDELLNAKTANGYEFINLGSWGWQLVNSYEEADERYRSYHEANSSMWRLNAVYQPDFVFIDLGTNDWDKITTEAGKQLYKKTLTRMIEMLEGLESAPTVVLTAPIKASRDVKPVHNLMLEVQAETGCAFVDLYETSANWSSADAKNYFTMNGQIGTLHLGENGNRAVAQYIVNTFFNKIEETIVSDSIRAYDFTYADNYEKYLGDSFYNIPVSERMTAEQYSAMFAGHIDELIAEAAPDFQAEAYGLDLASENSNGALMYALKFNNAIFEALGYSVRSGMIALPTASFDGELTLTTTGKTGFEGIKLANAYTDNCVTSNAWIRLNGSQSDKLAGQQISARAYVTYTKDGASETLYSPLNTGKATYSKSVKGVSRELAAKMIKVGVFNASVNIKYTDGTSAYFDGYETVDKTNYSALCEYITTGTDGTKADINAVQAFIKANTAAYSKR